MPKSDYEEAVNHKYRTVTGGPKIPGVTSVIGIIDKPALKWASAKIAATTAVDLYPEMRDRDEFIHLCRGEFDRVWREKAKRGNRVHSVAEEWARGNTVEVPLSDQGFVDALESFYRDHTPVTLMAERIVAHSYLGYGGRFDAIMEIDGSRFLIDFKTGGHYPIDVAMQTSAYMAASLAMFDAEGSLVGFERLPALDGARILYLAEDGSYDLVDPFEDISREKAFAAFCHALGLFCSIREMEKMTKEKK